MGMLNIVNKYLLKKKWRKINSHNRTRLGKVTNFDCVSIGNGTYGPIYAEISRKDVRLIIGNYCSIAENVTFILSSEHKTNLLSTFPFDAIYGNNNSDAGSKGNIVVGDDVWIGYGSIILSGVNIGQGAVIAAGSVVTKNVEPYSVVGGVPAKLLKYRFSDDVINLLKQVDYNKVDYEIVKNNPNLFGKTIGEIPIELLKNELIRIGLIGD